MALVDKHPAYTAMAGTWKICRDAAAGQKAIHDPANRERYLPKLEGERENDYAARVARATFFNATWRTVAGLLGMLFRKPPVAELPESTRPLLDDVTMGGVSLDMLARRVAEECLIVGRVGLLVDHPTVDISGLTAAQAAELNLRPTIALYRAESVYNWRTSWINNRSMLSQVRMTEEHTDVLGDFEEATETRYRVLDLVRVVNEDQTESVVYRQRLYRLGPRGEEIQIGGDIFPLMNGQRLGYIPFTFVSVDDTTPDIDEPPLVDLVYVNLSHYRTTADRKHGAHKTALPQPYIAGYEMEPGQRLSIGGSDCWVFPHPDARAEYLEYQGQGLGTLSEELDREEAQMAVLGARMLEAQKKAQEAAETAAIHRTGENATLSSAAQAMSDGITIALRIYTEWAGAPDEKATYKLNDDFLPMPMTPEELTAQVASWQQGAISKEQLFRNLKQGEIVDDNANFEDEETKIANSPPSLLTPANGAA